MPQLSRKKVLRRSLAVLAGVMTLNSYALAADTIKFAIIQPMTGPQTQYGDQIRAGALTAIEAVNAAGGIRGKQIEPLLIDDGCEPKQAVPAANQAANAGAKFAVAHGCSGTMIPAVPVYESEGIVTITPGATSPAVTDTRPGHFIFRTIGRDDQQGPYAAQYVLTHVKPQKTAIIHDKQTYGAGIAAQVKATLEKGGANILIYEGINPGDSDYSALISKIKSAGIDFIYFGGYHPELGLLLRQANEQGLKAQFMGPEASANKDLVAIAGAAIDGLLVTLPSDFTKKTGNEAIVKAYQDAKRDPDGAFTMPAYAAVEVLTTSIEAVGDDSEAVADYMHANTFQTSIGEVSFDSKGDLKAFEFGIFKWDRNGNKTQVQ